VRREGDGESEKPLPPENPPPPLSPPRFFLSTMYIYIYSLNVYYAFIYICTHCQILRPHRTAARVPFFGAIHPRRPANRSAPTHFRFSYSAAKMEGDSRDSPLKRHSVATETTPPTIATVTATVAAATTTTTTACPSVSPYYIYIYSTYCILYIAAITCVHLNVIFRFNRYTTVRNGQ